MRKSLAVLAVLGAFSVAGAHDFWLVGQNDDKLRVQIGFGDGFATCEPIDKQRENNFEIPVVIDKNGKWHMGGTKDTIKDANFAVAPLCSQRA